MTKRMLSLLLALVMTLSLCVPALAADEFAAEAVTEVEEQAPAAPVEPEAPEAEEPVEEPVADEPVVEEADAPEIAAVMEEEDLPYLVALGVVSKEAHWALYKAVAAADEVMPRVEAGELYESNASDFTFTPWSRDADATTYLSDPEKYDPLKEATDEFMAAYETAKKYLDAIDGVIIDEDVTTNTVQAAANALAKYVVKTDPKYSAYKLTDKADAATPFKQANLLAFLRHANRTYKATDVSGMNKGSLTDPLTINTTTEVDTAAWKKAYHADYLEKLQAAIDTVAAYNDKAVTYKDFTTALNQVLEVIKAEAAGARPAASDMSALTSAMSSAQTAKDNYKTGDNAKYVLDTTDTSLGNLIGAAKGLLNDYQGLNGFATSATYYAYNDAINNINNALVEKTDSINYEANKLSATGVDVTLSVKKVDGYADAATDGDGNDYGYSFKVNDQWHTASGWSEDEADADITALKGQLSGSPKWAADAKYSGKLIGTLPLANANSVTIKVGDTITLRFHKKDTTGGGTYSTYAVKTFTFTVTNGYNGPVIDDVTYLPGDATLTVSGYTADKLKDPTQSLTASLNATNDESTIYVELTGKIEAATAFRLEVMNGKQYVAYEQRKGSNAIGSFKDNVKQTLGNRDNTYLVGGDMTATLKIFPNDDLSSDNYFVWDTETFAVEPLSKWTEVAQVKKILADVQKLQQGDYKFNASTRVDVFDLTSAFQTINSDVSKLTNYISDPTVANSNVNRDSVVSILNDIFNVRSFLTKKTADTANINKLLADAKAIIDEGEDPWTFDSWGALKDAFKAGNVSLAGKLQSEVDALAADLQAALNGMTKEGEVDKTALNKAITDAKALKEADYTPESWAAAKAAIDEALDAAETVAANDKATQAQVNTALNALNTALSKLVKTAGEGVQPPKSGTGWVYDPTTGDYYFFKNSKLVSNYWVGKVDGASMWDGNWYYVGSDGKLFTGMAYIDDLHGGYGWYFLQPTDKNGEIGKMLTGWQYVGVQNGTDYGTCYFSAKNGESGKCTYSTTLGNWNGTGWVK